MKKILFPWLIISNLCLVACSDELKKASDTPSASTKTLKSLTRDAFSYSLTPTSEPNKYQMVISWGKTSDLVEVSTQGQKKFSSRESSENFSEVLEGGKTYQYSVAIFNPDRSLKDQIDYSIEVPKDYVLSGSVEIKGDTTIAANRLFIKGDAQVTTYRNRLIINANQIFSEGGTIQNYPWGLVDCLDGSSGNAGGDISIFAKSAQGNLNISMLGAKGCFPMGPGGPGGKLTVIVDDGGNLSIATQMKASPGADEKPGMYRAGYQGVPATSCISLTEEDKGECHGG